MNKNQEPKSIAKDISVLYVEDNQFAREQTVKILSRIFDDIDVAENGEKALKLYMNKKHDLIISDILMNIMNGLEMSKIIKNMNPNQNIIFISAYTEQKFLIKAIEIGVDNFIFKPVDVNKMISVLEKSIDQILILKENANYKENLEKLVEERTNDLIIKNYELKRMIKEVDKANLIKEEMRLAQKVQEKLLPASLPKNKRIEIATFCEPALYVGGDYYDIFYGKDGEINFFIADVSGHGLGPSITMSTFRGVCRSILTLDIPFERQLEKINKIMCEDAQNNEFFITGFFLKYYEDSHSFEYINIGHNDILYYKKEEDELESLPSSTIPMAIMEDTVFKTKKHKINDNDFIVLYTDGLIEAFNKEHEMFGTQNLISIIKESKSLTSSKILENIQIALNNFIKDEPKKDDTTLLILKFI